MWQSGLVQLSWLREHTHFHATGFKPSMESLNDLASVPPFAKRYRAQGYEYVDEPVSLRMPAAGLSCVPLTSKPRSCVCVWCVCLYVPGFLFTSAHAPTTPHAAQQRSQLSASPCVLLPDAILATIFAYVPGCESVVPLLSRRWGSDRDDAWKLVALATWGTQYTARDKQARDEDMAGVVSMASDPRAGTWHRYYCQRRARDTLAADHAATFGASLLCHPAVTPAKREQLVDWMIEVCDRLGCSERPMHMAVDLVDMRIATHPDLQLTELQATGSAALLVALEVRGAALDRPLVGWGGGGCCGWVAARGICWTGTMM